MISGYPTVVDAAKELGVSSKTIRTYIEKQIIAEPPKIDWGLRTVSIFPPDYMEDCKRKIEDYKCKVKEKNAKNVNIR